MIRGLAHAGAVLREERYVRAAQKAADFLLVEPSRMRKAVCFASARAGRRSTGDFWMIMRFLFRRVLASLVREDARAIGSDHAREVLSGPDGGFFYTDERASDLIVRQMIGSDSPLPSGNGVAAMALLELGQLLKRRGRLLPRSSEQVQSVGQGMSALVEAAYLFVKDQGRLKKLSCAMVSCDRCAVAGELAA